MTPAALREGMPAIVLNSSHMHAKAVELGKHVLRMTTAAGSGHPSSALALTHIIVELMYRTMRYDPADPWHPASDRLVLSIGHAVPIVYAAYADLTGAVGTDRARRKLLQLNDLASLRELSSVLDGHPNPAEGFPFFDAATGSLGQGLSVAAGLALAARIDRIDKRIFVIAGDGESREGQVWEAADFIVDHKLVNVCAIFSCNGEGQAGPVSGQQRAGTLAGKLRAFGWHVIEIDGHDPDEIVAAVGQVGTAAKPLALIARTVKGWGVNLWRGKNYHGKPLAADELEIANRELDATGKSLGAAPGPRFLPQKLPAVPRSTAAVLIEIPSFAQALKRLGLEKTLESGRMATRAAYGAALVALGDADQRVVALDADVSNSTYSNVFAKAHPDRFFECKIAEQNMISAAAGLAAAGKIPFASSFAKFIARATDQIDMASISRANIKIVGSHAGVSLAADGPSQMSLADLAYFRSMTRTRTDGGKIACHVFHPSDAVSCYRCVEMMANVGGLCYLRTHRPDARILYPLDEPFGLEGCKQLRTGDHLTLVSSGFMLHTVLDAADQLARSGVRCSVFDVYAFPLDATPILGAAQSGRGVILVVEDNYLGGVHAELSEAAAETGSVRVHGLTVSRIPKSARTADEVFAYVGVGLSRIVERAMALARN